MSTGTRVTRALATAADQELEGGDGESFLSLNAQLMRIYMTKYGARARRLRALCGHCPSQRRDESERAPTQRDRRRGLFGVARSVAIPCACSMPRRSATARPLSCSLRPRWPRRSADRRACGSPRLRPATAPLGSHAAAIPSSSMPSRRRRNRALEQARVARTDSICSSCMMPTRSCRC